jgi:hypothetical protein
MTLRRTTLALLILYALQTTFSILGSALEIVSSRITTPLATALRIVAAALVSGSDGLVSSDSSQCCPGL